MKRLSGGMKRRAGIAQAMLNNPRILILDEPTAGLDPNERIRFRNLISELSEERIVLLSTHIVSDIEYAANEILLMKNGQIKMSGTSEEIIYSMSEKVWKQHLWKIYFYTILEKRQVERMFRYEIKKVFSKRSRKIAILLLMVIVGITCWFAMDVSFVNCNLTE